MKAKHYVAVLAIVALLMPALWAVVHAAEKPNGRIPQPTYTTTPEAALRGLPGVSVSVAYVQRPGQKRLGSTPEALRTDVELQLRQGGIEVLSEQESDAKPHYPCLCVSVRPYDLRDNYLVFPALSIEVELKETVYLVRDPATTCRATTWNRCTVAAIQGADLAVMRHVTRMLLAIFIDDYLVANPKRPAPASEARGSEANQG
jgi:hypothetical protein